MLDQLSQCRTCTVGSCAIYGATWKQSADLIAELRKEDLQVKSQRTFLRRGDMPKRMYTLRTGWAFRFTQLQNGERQILSFLIPGDNINFEYVFSRDATQQYSVRSLTDVDLCSFDIPEIQETLCERGDQMLWSSEFLRRQMEYMDRRLTNIGKRSATGRVAHFVLEIEERLRRVGLSNNASFDFPIRQDHIADALGLSPVHVNRTLVKLRKQGLIELKSGRLSIPDVRVLKSAADED